MMSECENIKNPNKVNPAGHTNMPFYSEFCIKEFMVIWNIPLAFLALYEYSPNFPLKYVWKC
jgi:hypothetical protein